MKLNALENAVMLMLRKSISKEHNELLSIALDEVHAEYNDKAASKMKDDFDGDRNEDMEELSNLIWSELEPKLAWILWKAIQERPEHY